MNEIPFHFQDKIEVARRQRSKILDLSDLPDLGFSGSRLTAIPSEVFALVHLETLDVSNNQIMVVPEEIKELRRLKILRLKNNYIEIVPPAIGLLPELELLDLSENQISSLPPEIGRLSKLHTLKAGNKLSELPKELGDLNNLTALSLVANRRKPPTIRDWLTQLRDITEIELVNFDRDRTPGKISSFRDLRVLNLSGNKLTEIPKWIGELKKLTTLKWGSNQLAEVPACLSDLKELRTLALNDNQIAAIPAFLGTLRDLEHLDLSENHIETLPESLGDLAHLQILGLANNQLASIPDAVYRLKRLKSLNLNKNEIRLISLDLLELTELQVLHVLGNPITIPPPEIVAKGFDDIKNYFKQLTAEGTDFLYEAKLLIVGEGGAGKTTLVKKILDPNYGLREEDSTRGIDIVRWPIPLDNGRTFQVNIWDFGGQEIYHATHQFFLTKRSLYALVADTRKGDTDFYYWLNVAELLSDGSPILIIKNERQDRHWEINERDLRGRFTNLEKTLATNLATGRGLDNVKEEIRHRITHLPHVGTPLPKTWVRVREALEQDPRNYITVEEYLSICEKHGFAGHKARLQLGEYLHDLGVCLHFQDDPLLKKTVILRPKWGTDAVYKVLDNPRVIRNLGRFTSADLEHIWEEPEYADVHDELLQLMMKFKLCYRLPFVADTFIAPQLLSANQPDFSWQDADNLLLRYTYEFMPKGILPQFIVAMHASIDEQRLVWKSGVVLSRKSGVELSKDQTLAEVIEHYDRREIRIRVTGKHRKELLIIATHELDKIHASYPRLEYNKLVPCNCSVCKGNPEPHFYKLNVLHRYIEDGQATIQCQRRPYEMVDVLALVDDVVDRERLMPMEARTRSGFTEESRSQVVIQGSVGQLVMQQTSGGESTIRLEERRDESMARPSKDTVKARSAWANGLFYLLVFVVVIAAVGLLAKTVPWYVLPIVLVAGAIFVPLIGALQLKMDERLSDKSFLELMKLVVGQLPLIGRMSRQRDEETQ